MNSFTGTDVLQVNVCIVLHYLYCSLNDEVEFFNIALSFHLLFVLFVFLSSLKV